MKRTILTVTIASIVVVLFSYAVLPPLRAAVDQTYDQIKLLMDVMELVRENYVEPRENKELLTGAIHGMVRTLDPFSQYLEQKDYREMKTETEGEFGGLGIRIAIKNDLLTVITPLPGTPAYRAGILPEDRIIKVGTSSVQGISLEDAVALLRGTPGTTVSITVVRDGTKEPLAFALVREVIKIETIRARMVDRTIGYVQMTEFSATTEKDLERALADLTRQGMRGLVLDLRNNPGGLLEVAVDVCRQFVGNGKLIVYTQGRERSSRREYRTRGRAAPYGKLPFVILVNRGSASGSEIVAGAMQDLKRALIVGTTTFGKGSVQSVLPFNDGSALRLTTAKYYTPAGRSIHRDERTGTGGVVPDIFAEVPREIEAKLYAQSELLFAAGKEPQSAVKREEQVVDVALQKAVESLKKKVRRT